jgi:hypothetical protein
MKPSFKTLPGGICLDVRYNPEINVERFAKNFSLPKVRGGEGTASAASADTLTSPAAAETTQAPGLTQ